MKTGNTIDGEQVRACWHKIKSARGEDFFIEQFYNTMFNHAPETRHLFPQDMSAQHRSLLTTLDNVINGIDYIDQLESDLIKLGERHKQIGIRTDMFHTFNQVIVETANLAADHSLSPEEQTAWKQAFQQVSEIMLKAYQH